MRLRRILPHLLPRASNLGYRTEKQRRYKQIMRKVMFNRVKIACILTTCAGLATLVSSAADTQTPPATSTTPGNSGYQTTTPSTSGDHSAKSFIKQAFR